MALSKTFGPVTISEAGGVVTISAAMPAIGGGAMAGVVSGSASVSISGSMLLDAGLALASEKLPSMSAEIALIKAALDTELAKA